FGDRAIDGRLVLDWIAAHPRPRDLATLPPPLAIAAGDGDALNDLFDAFAAWFERLLSQPAGADDSAWDPQRLEYPFASDSPAPPLTASEYPGGTLDWHAFDQARAGASPTTTTTSFVPVAVEFAGMANTRWWSFEDRRVSFGAVKPDTTDLAKLLLLEFGLVYANDWCLVPWPLANVALAEVLGLAVTNVFGERLWIEPAARARATRLHRRRPLAPHLLMLPTVP